MTGAAGVGAALMAAGCAKEEEKPKEPEKVKLNVYNPTGDLQITQLFAPRLDTLEGKTIAFISDDAWEDARTFPIIQKYLEDTYHCTVYSYENFTHGVEFITPDDNGIPEALKEKGVDAVIVGNAG